MTVAQFCRSIIIFRAFIRRWVYYFRLKIYQWKCNCSSCSIEVGLSPSSWLVILIHEYIVMCWCASFPRKQIFFLTWFFWLTNILLQRMTVILGTSSHKHFITDTTSEVWSIIQRKKKELMSSWIINQQTFMALIICLILCMVLQWRENLSSASIPEDGFNLMKSTRFQQLNE